MNFKEYYGYVVFTDGRIWSNKRNIFLVPSVDKEGYYRIWLYINKKRKFFSVSRLMGQLFLPNFYNLPQVDHRDRNRANNNLYNLKWKTRSDNNHNQGMKSTNTSGIKGVSYHKRHNRWEARLVKNGKTYQRGFKEKDDAIKYRKELENKYMPIV